MPDEDCPVISPQGKEPLKKLCLWQNNLFLFGSSETLFGCSSVGGKQPAFPGGASLYPSSHPGFCGPRRKGAWLLVWIFQSRAFCNGHSWAKSWKLPLTCVLQTTQPSTLCIISVCFHQSTEPLPLLVDVCCQAHLNQPVLHVFCFPAPQGGESERAPVGIPHLLPGAGLRCRAWDRIQKHPEPLSFKSRAHT